MKVKAGVISSILIGLVLLGFGYSKAAAAESFKDGRVRLISTSKTQVTLR